MFNINEKQGKRVGGLCQFLNFHSRVYNLLEKFFLLMYTTA